MYANYHTHTPRCRHAQGSPREYVENAVRSGIKLLGFSDHVPYPFGIDFFSGARMDISQTESYVTEILSLKEEYKDRIRILIGYEAEYYPACFQAMLENICRFECDYLILGQHHLRNEYDGVYCGTLTDEKERLTQYVDQVIEGLNTGLFSCIAHPDLLHYRGDEGFYREEAYRLCEHAKKLSIPLEINFLGLSEDRHYPYEPFWQVVQEVGNDVIFGCDAHTPDFIGNAALEEKGKAFAARFGITPLQTLKLKQVAP